MKRYIKLLLIFIFIIFLSGCTKILKDDENKRVVFEKTGQGLTENIVCQPTNKKVVELYKKNNIKIDVLPKCDQFKLTEEKYEGIWTSLFVKPLVWLILKLGVFVNNYGISLIIVSILIRLVLYPATKGTALQSENLKKAKPELDRIEKKYKDKKSQEDVMKKSQEIMLIYKKNNINPLSGCLFGFIQLPLFFAFLEAINRTPAIFEEDLLSFQLGTTPYIGIQNGQFQYLILMILLLSITYFAFKLNKTAAVNNESQKQMEFVSKIMIFIIGFASLNFSTAISIYWIASNTFTIIQNKIVQRSKE